MFFIFVPAVFFETAPEEAVASGLREILTQSSQNSPALGLRWL